MQSMYLKIIIYIKALQQQNRSLLSQAARSKTGIADSKKKSQMTPCTELAGQESVREKGIYLALFSSGGEGICGQTVSHQLLFCGLTFSIIMAMQLSCSPADLWW